jgi:WD40 repeat protein
MAKLVIWDYKAVKKLHTMDLGPVQAPISSLAFNHNGSILIAGDKDGMIRFFDMHSYKAFQAKNITNQSALLAVRFCPDFNSILTLSASGRLQEWSTKMFGTCVKEWRTHGSGYGSGYQQMGCSDLTFSNDERFLVTSSPDAHVPLYNLGAASARQPSFLPGLDGAVVTLDWHSRYIEM